MQTPVTSPDPALSSWLHIPAPHPSLPGLALRLMQLPTRCLAVFFPPLLMLQFTLSAPTLDLAPGPCAYVAPGMDGPILGQGVAPSGTPVQNTGYQLWSLQ